MDGVHRRVEEILQRRVTLFMVIPCSEMKICAIICLRHNLNKKFLSWENYFGKKCFPFYSCRDGKRLCRNNKGQHFFGASLVGAHFLFCLILELVNFAKYAMCLMKRSQCKYIVGGEKVKKGLKVAALVVGGIILFVIIRAAIVTIF